MTVNLPVSPSMIDREEVETVIEVTSTDSGGGSDTVTLMVNDAPQEFEKVSVSVPAEDPVILMDPDDTETVQCDAPLTDGVVPTFASDGE